MARDLLLKRMAFLRDEAGEVVALEMLPEPFYGVEVQTVGREVNRLDVMPDQPLCLVPAVVENEQDLPLFTGDSVAMVSRNAWKTSVSHYGTMRLTILPLEGLAAPMTFLRRCPPW